MDQNYVVLARKWRPARFSDIVGQQHIVRTLMNAIRAQRLHQAYLFTGSRGIGKTSIARIFAKAIRCEHTSLETSDGVAPEGARAIEWLKSCDQCPSCREIAASTSVDVIEIDGASNNGVDAVREIRENAKFMPASGSRKIYIIDEVHMLTTAAFNALLKTLEEPPPHVIFIFATTEPHKIPATILSRCQRFDFRRVTMGQIQQRLLEVTAAEGIQVEPAALALIGRAAEGGMRDAMSLLDQVISFSGNTITAQAVRESVGLIEGQTLLGIVSGIFARKPLEALELVEQAYQRGHDLRVLTRSLIEYLHGAVLSKIGAPHSGNLELSEDEWKELSQASALRSLEEIELIFQVLHHGLEWIARSPQPKVVLDVLLVKCATAEALVYADQQPANSTGGAASAGSSTTQHRNTANSPANFSAATPAPVVRTQPAADTSSQKVSTAIWRENRQNQALSSTQPTGLAAFPPNGASDLARGPVTPAGPIAAAHVPASVAPASIPTAPASNAARTWEGFVAHIRKSRPLLASILEHGHCENFTAEEELLICYPPQDAYYKDQLQSRAYAEQLLTLSKEYCGKATRLRIELRESGESLAARRERELKEREQNARKAAQNHPMILEAKALFGGELGPIELTDMETNASP